MSDSETRDSEAGAVRQRSSSGLTRCVKCRRHIVAGPTPATTECPFCGGKGGRRSARGGLLAATMLAMACGASDSAPEDPVGQEQTEGQEATDETYSESDADEEEDAVADNEPEQPEQVPVPAYGAPPPQDDNFEAEPAPDMQPMARYGLAPRPRPQK